MDRLARALLVLLAVILPFELTTPLLRLGPLEITNVELVWYLLVSAAVVRWVRAGPPHWTIVHGATALWAAAVILSAILAPSDRAAAVKFALRNVSGCSLFLITADLITTPGRAGGLMLALSLGACVSAAAAVAEIWLPGAPPVLSAFKTLSTTVGGFLRAGGTFGYPNTGAMYWEATLPVLLAVGVWRAQRARAFERWLALAAALLLLVAIVLSASRGGMIIAFAVTAAMGVVPQRVAPGLRTLAIITMAALAAVTVTASRLPMLRFSSSDWATWYRAEYQTGPLAEVQAGHSFAATVTIRNTGLVVWPSRGDHPVTLGYCWQVPAADSTLCADAVRPQLPHDVEPDTEVTMAAQVFAPVKPGAYLLQWDMVVEGGSWFQEYGAASGKVPVTVVPAEQSAPSARVSFRPPPPPIVSPPERMELWRTAVGFWEQRPLVGIGPDNFRRQYGGVLGLRSYDERMHANSWYLETLADTGLIGALALLGLMSSLIVTARKGWRSAGSVERQLLGLGLALGVGTFFVHGLVDYFLPFTPTLGLFWMLAGAAVGLENKMTTSAILDGVEIPAAEKPTLRITQARE